MSVPSGGSEPGTRALHVSVRAGTLTRTVARPGCGARPRRAARGFRPPPLLAFDVPVSIARPGAASDGRPGHFTEGNIFDACRTYPIGRPHGPVPVALCRHALAGPCVRGVWTRPASGKRSAAVDLSRVRRDSPGPRPDGPWRTAMSAPAPPALPDVRELEREVLLRLARGGLSVWDTELRYQLVRRGHTLTPSGSPRRPGGPRAHRERGPLSPDLVGARLVPAAERPAPTAISSIPWTVPSTPRPDPRAALVRGRGAAARRPLSRKGDRPTSLARLSGS